MFRPLFLSTILLLIGQMVQATDYYWVEGSGNWSDINHWATSMAGRDLYWVGKGGTGSWYDRANWAATSGGVGGELIPTAMDNVFFDANSFDGPGQSVISRDQYAYCKNMSWTGVTNNPINFGMWVLNAYGSVDLPENKVGGISELRLLSTDQNQTLLTRGFHIYNALLNGTGSWILQDTLSATNLYQRAGEFNSNGKPVTTETFFMLNDDSPSLKMGNSHWRITRNGSLSSSLYSFFIGPTATVDAGTSLLEFTNTMPTYITYTDVKFHNVLFSNPAGTASLLSDYQADPDKIPKVSTFNRIEMRNSGVILGENVIDSLIFTAGKSYDLDAAHAQTIQKYFQLVGNPCDSIELRSTLLGRKAIVQMNGGVVRADFVQMRDQSGVGSTQFLAGANSTNSNNSNENWVFSSSIEEIYPGVLGKDAVLCNHDSITLDANTFNFNEKYLWSDGSTNATLLVNHQSGTYNVAVTYRLGCVLYDTVNVLSLSEFEPKLIKDTTLCDNQDLVLNADLKLIGATCRWQDGSSNAQIVVTQAGKYKVAVELSGCSVADSTTVRMISAAALNLGRDTTISGVESLLLDASKTGSRNYLWSDNSSAPTLLVHTSGTYWVEVNDGGCSARDTIVVKACLASGLSLGRDSVFCAGASFDLRSNLGGAVYRWQDGSSNISFQATATGLYWLEAIVNGCSYRDSINLLVQALPRFELGNDTILCKGETLTLHAISGVNQLHWSTGSTNETISVINPGIFWAKAVHKKCSFVDSISVTYKPIPTVSLGQDTMVCDDKPYLLRAIANKGTPLLWQDGSSKTVLNATAPGTYWVKALNDRCFSIDSLELTFHHCAFFKAFTPNAFSPNGNNANEAFRPYVNELIQVKSYELQVYDRWGGRVFRSIDLDTGWDGSIRGQIAPQGMYRYWFRIEYIDDKGPGNALMQGEVNLIR